MCTIAWGLLLMPLHTAAFVTLSRFSSFPGQQSLLLLLALIHCYSEVLSEPQFAIVAFVEDLPIFTSLSGILALLVICEMPVEVALLNFESYTGGRPEVDHSIVIT